MNWHCNNCDSFVITDGDKLNDVVFRSVVANHVPEHGFIYDNKTEWGFWTEAPKKNSHRKEFLDEVNSLINGDRNAQYGEPSQDFDRTAKMVNAYLSGILQRKIPATYALNKDIFDSLVESHDIAWIQILLKASRSTVSPTKRDHYLDAAGYAACGEECASENFRG